MRHVLFLCFASMAASQLAAQVDPDSIHHRNDCRLAMQIISDGQPANKFSWALGIAPSCGRDFGATVAAKLRASRQSAYSPALGSIADRTFELKDAVLLDASLEVAGDPTASRDVRVLSLRTAVWQVASTPIWGRFETLATGEPYDGSFRCPGTPVVDVVVTTGEPITRDQILRARDLGVALALDESAPPDVRRMGACLRSRSNFRLQQSP